MPVSLGTHEPDQLATIPELDRRRDAAGRLRTAMDGLPLTLREDVSDYHRQWFVVVTDENRRAVISEDFIRLAADMEAGRFAVSADKPYPTLRDALEAFARGENAIRYQDAHGRENIVTLWSSEMEQWI